MIGHLIRYLEKHAQLSSEEKDYLVQNVPIRTLSKDTLLLSEGEVSQSFFFICKGSVHLYYNLELEEKTAFFYFEDMFVSSYESFTKQVPSRHNLKTIEETTLAVISAEVAQNMLERFPKFDFLARVMMEEELIVYQEIISSFITLNAEKRYLKLLETNPQVAQRIPQYQLASFLGVAPETLSRIRRRIQSRRIY